MIIPNINVKLLDTVKIYRIHKSVMHCYIESIIYEERNGYEKCRLCKYRMPCNREWYKVMR